ncbi:MAG: glycoside hydrolase family 15 protein [Oligoflexales bacterium]
MATGSMEYGLVGNCQYNALIDRHGEVVWLCWPRFDSSFVFGSLLDGVKGGRYTIGPPSRPLGDQAYITNTNILRTIFQEEDGAFEVIDFAPRFFLNHRYYKPNMLIRIVRPLSGSPQVKVSISPRYEYGLMESGAAFGSNHISFSGFAAHVRLTTNASLSFVADSIPFLVDRTYYFVLTYGEPLEREIKRTCEEFLERTTSYWQTWVKHCHLPLRYQKEVIRSALVLKIHQYEDTGAIIASTTTSIPEADKTVRTWDYRYCWLRDAVFSLWALQRLTQFEELEKFIGYLKHIVQMMGGSDQYLQPVYGIGGEKNLDERVLDYLAGYKDHKPVRVGNQAAEHIQHDIYGEMILAISQVFLDARFASETVSPPTGLVRKLLDKIEETLEREDAGLWEFRGIAQLHSFTLLMHWLGASVAYHIGKAVHDPEITTRSERLRNRAAMILNEKCWNESIGAFTQASGSRHLDASLLMAVNLGFINPKDPRAKQHVLAIAQDLNADNGFIYRYRVSDDFGRTDNAFILCSFWLAEAYARIGEREKATELFEKLISSSNHLGLLSEDLNPRTKELWGNFPQTYSHVGLINTAFALAPSDFGSGYFSFSHLS